MKLYLTAFLAFVMISAEIFSQGYRGRHAPRERFEEFEKMKIIEILDLEEESAVRFFARRNTHMKDQRALIEKRDSLLRSFYSKMKEPETEIAPEEYDQNLDTMFEIETELFQKRRDFYSSLDDILTKEQVAKLVVFEYRVMREARNIMQRKREEMRDY
jgi:hypothetical protein